jgi:hypothetical protein
MNTTQKDFATWTEKAARMAIAELAYSIRDCYEAAQAMSGHNPAAEGRYMDELATYRAELNRR